MPPSNLPSKRFSISQLASELKISTRSIRFYEERGLIAPQRTSGNQRIYGKRDRARLKLILRGKRFGYSLIEIAVPPYTVTCSSTDQGGAGCPGDPHILTYTYVALDDCGKADTCTQTITVVDNTPPVFSGCPADATVECDNVPPPANPTATDNCGGSVTITFSEDSTGSCPYTLTRTWEAEDECGNVATCVQVLTVDDTTPPVCSTINDDTYQQCTPEEVCIPVSATDNCDADVTCSVISGPGTVSGGNWCYTPSGSEVANVTIECVDNCGNTCQESFAITFDLSNLPPVTTFTGGSSPPLCTPPIHVITYSSIDPNGDPVTCTNTNPNATLGANTWQYSPTPGEHVVDTIICCDPCGACDSLIVDITFPAASPPICEVPADTSIFMCDPVQVCLPAFATGATCSVISGPGSIVGGNWCYTPSGSEVANVTVECAGICDTCTASFTVTFTVGTPPSITCPGDLSFACDADVPACDPNDATVTGGTAPVTVSCSSTTNGLDGCPGGAKIYTYTYIATDACGKADTCEQTITVLDNVPPSITCPDDLTIECDASTDPANTGSATGSDNCAGAVSISHVDNETPGACSQAKTITRTWTATDVCGNTASCDQIITVEDNTNPTIACPAGITVECVTDVPAADINSVTASDNCGAVTVTWEGDGALVGGPCGGTITRTYRATDECGNFAECTQTITIDDNTNPTIACPSDITVECVADVPAADINSVTAADNCGSVTVTWEGDG